MNLIGCLPQIEHHRVILIAGPTASGKSALALEIAQRFSGVVVNADALQVFENWRILTARPSPADEKKAPHALYGHIRADQVYSVGDWLNSVRSMLTGTQRLIIVGGTGLYFKALTQGLADIPPIAPQTRDESQALLQDAGLDALLKDLDQATKEKIDTKNPMRVLRAHEILKQTGRSILDWHAETPAPVLALDHCAALVLETDKSILNARINERFDQMLNAGALEEAEQNNATWSPHYSSSKAIGARELIAHIRGEMSLADAKEAATLATRQYAKRQRTWFRNNMKQWVQLDTQKLN